MLLDLSSQLVNCHRYLAEDHLEVEECAAGRIIFAEALPKSFCWVGVKVPSSSPLGLHLNGSSDSASLYSKGGGKVILYKQIVFPLVGLFYFMSLAFLIIDGYLEESERLLGRTSGVAFGVCVSS